MPKRKSNSDSNYESKCKRSKLDDDFRHLSVKCTLNSILNDHNRQDVKNTINDIVTKISIASIEVCKLINLHLLKYLKKFPDTPMHKIEQVFVDRAFILVTKCSRKIQLYENKDEELESGLDLLEKVFEKVYKPLRPKDYKVISRNNLTSLRQSARERIITSGMMHIVRNFKKRTITWLKYKLDGLFLVPNKPTSKIITTLANYIYVQVFNMDQEFKVCGFEKYLTKDVLDLILQLTAKRRKLKIRDANTYNLKVYWYRYIPWLYMILNDFANYHKSGKKIPRGMKLFTLFPEHKIRPLHILINDTTLQEIWRHMESDDCKSDNLWDEIFNVKKFPKSGKAEFLNSITTDGYSANILFQKGIVKRHSNYNQNEDNELEVNPDKKLTIQMKNNQRIVAIDPGRRDIFVGITNREEMIKCSNSEYYSHAGFKRSIKLEKRWRAQCPQVKKALSNMTSSRVSTVTEYTSHIKYFLENVYKIFNFYFQKKFRRLRLMSYMSKRRAMDKMCKRITNGDPNTVVVYGSAQFSSSSRGNPSSPNKYLINRLHTHCNNIVMVDEYRTSQLCSTCKHLSLIEPKHLASNKRRKRKNESKSECKTRDDTAKLRRVFGVRFCTNCRKHWNRDVNAARNLMSIFVHQIKYNFEKRKSIRLVEIPCDLGYKFEIDCIKKDKMTSVTLNLDKRPEGLTREQCT